MSSPKPTRNNPASSKEHVAWMQRALALAARGRYGVSPNPMVGACLVKNGKLIAEGYHALYGSDHAEVDVLEKAKGKARGATLYVTLEPCSSWGKTPPCTEAILKSGIREVVIALEDPNPQNHGGGIRALKKAGIRVLSGVLRAEAKKMNESFEKWMGTKKPFVTLKMAQSLDGKIATRTGHSRWISGPEAREFVHHLRAEQDAVMVGTGTLKKDDPFLSPRIRPVKGRESKPWRIVLDPRFEISSKARVLNGDQLTFLVVSEKNLKIKKRFPCAVIPVQEKFGRLDLNELLGKLGALGVSKLLVEGGGELAWSLIDQKLVDRFYWIVSPKFIGGREAKTSAEGLGVKLASEAYNCEIHSVTKLGSDFLFEGCVK